MILDLSPLLLFMIRALILQTDDTDWLLVYATIALVGVTLGLVGVTSYYAIQTHYTVREMKRATESQFLPFVIATFKAISSAGNLNFVVKNLGKGAAVEITINFTLKDQSGKFENRSIELIESHQDKMIDTGISRSPDFNSKNLDEIYEHYKEVQTTIITRIDYKDILNKNYTKEQSFDITADLKNKG